MVVAWLCATATGLRAATISWTSPTSGDWNTASNWTPNQVPGSSDTVFITNNATFTVTVASGLSVACLTLGGASGAQTVNWSGGTLSGDLTIASNGVLTVSGVEDRYLSGTLTNAGTMVFTGTGAATFYAGRYATTRLVNLPGGLLDFQNDQTLYSNGEYGSTMTFINQGTVRKSAGSGRLQLGVAFYNYGTLDAQVGIVSLSSTYSLLGGTLAFGFQSRTNYGHFDFPNTANLAGGLSATLLGGYVPNSYDTFQVMTFSARAGSFSNSLVSVAADRCFELAYGATTLALITHLNSATNAPVLAAIGDYTVNEGSLLTFANAATDQDGDPLTFSLVNAPEGAVLNPTTGVFTWMPSEAQGPSTNVLAVTVTDRSIWHLSATQHFTVVVREVNTAPVLASVATQYVSGGSLFALPLVATDADVPTNTLTFTLAAAPKGMRLTPDGMITWLPPAGQGASTNLVTVVVTDFNPWAVNGQRLSTTNSFAVVVIDFTAAHAPTATWMANRVLGPNVPGYPWAGVYVFDQLTIGDNVLVTSSNISHLVIKLDFGRTC